MDVDPDRDLGDGSHADVEFDVLGGPGGGPPLRLDHERFAYAGKFVMSNTGKAVARVAGGQHGDGATAAGGDRDGAMAAGGDDGGAGGSGDEEGRAEDDVVAAAAFDRDRTDPSVVRIRYVTVRRDRRGEGLGPQLLAFLAERSLEGAGGTGAAREVRIAVNNPFAYEAAFKAGFGYTGERTGLAELLCARPGDRSVEAYRRGLSTFTSREDLDQVERAFVEERRESGLPPTVESVVVD